MYAGCLTNFANHATTHAFHIQSQEYGNRPCYVHVEGLQESDAVFNRGALVRFIRFVNANVIHEHGFRKNGRRVRRARPFAADRNV